MAAVVIALGANLGDRAANLRAAVQRLGEAGIDVTRCSSIWETPPVPADQPPYLNAVIAGETALKPADLLEALKRIEHALGRRPGRRWGPRPADLDILFYNELTLATEALSIPHPRIAERAFVLAPLSEVFPGPLPVLGCTAVELLATLDATGVERTSLVLSPER